MKKRLISILLTLLMVMSLFSGMSVSAYADTLSTEGLYKEYTLVEGDYVLRICQKMGINYYTCKDAIMALNNITSEAGFRSLSVGKVIKVPVSDSAAATIVSVLKGNGANGSTTSTTTNGTVSVAGTSSSDKVVYYLVPYTMQRGETVLGVCNSMGISFADYSKQIMALNGVSNWNKVNAGTTLLLPTNKTPAVGTTCYAVVQHKVASGETAYALCQKYGVDYGKNTKLLQALNNTENLANVKAGNNFYLPVATTIKAASTNTNTNNNTNSNNSNTNTNTNTNTNNNTANNNVKSYNLSANINTSYGSMEFYVNNKSVSTAKAGETVTVVVNTNSKKAIDGLVVKYADGRADVNLTANSFVMPACDVRVDAKISSGYNITINSNYSYKTAATVSGVSVSSATEGSSVKVISTDPSYAVKNISVYYSTLLGVKKEVTVNDDNYFLMPSKNVTIDVELAPVQTYNFYREDCVNGGFDIQVDGASVSKAAKGAKVTVVWEAIKGYEIGSITVTNRSTGKNINVFNNSFTMPASDVTIAVSFINNSNSIEIEAIEGGILRAYDKNGNPITEADTGDEVHIKAVSFESGYGLPMNLTVRRNADGHLVSFISDYVFKMPAGGVTITGKLSGATVKVALNIEPNNSENKVYFNNSLYADDNIFNAAVGSVITLRPLARDAYAFTRFEVFVGSSTKVDQDLTDMANEQGKIVVPSTEKVEVKAHFTANAIKIGAADIRGTGTVGYQVDGNTAHSCKIGDTVEIIAAPANAGFRVKAEHIQVLNKQTNKALNVFDSDNDGYFEFQMPAEGVSIIVIFTGDQHTITMRTEPSSLNGKSMWSLYVNEEVPSVENNTGNHIDAVSTVKANTGDLVALTLNEAFKEKYTIEKVVVTGNAGKDYSGGLEFNVNNNGLYGFYMVDDDVTITVYVKELTDKTISLLENISWNTSRGSVGSTIGSHTGAVVSTAKVGETVCIVPKAIAPYFVDADSLTITRNSDGGKFTKGNEGDPIIAGKFYPVTDGGKIVAWKYIMPEGGVTVHVDFKATKYNVNVNVYSSTDTAKTNNLNTAGYVSLLNTNAETLFEVTGSVQQFDYDTGVAVQLTDSGAQNYTIKSITVPGVTIGSYMTYNNVFYMPAKDVTVEVILEPIYVEPEAVGLPNVNSFNTTVKYYSNEDLTNIIDEAKVGQKVWVVVTPKTGYTSTAEFFNNLDDVKLESGTSKTLAGSKVYCVEVPEDGFAIEITEKLNKHALTIKFVDENGNAITTAGDAVKVNNRAVKNGDVISEVEYNSYITVVMNGTSYRVLSYSIDPDTNSNKMPDADATLKIVLVKYI